MQRLEGEFLRHFSKAEKAILILSVIFVLFVGGYFLGQNSWRPAYTVEVAGLGQAKAQAQGTAQTETTGTGSTPAVTSEATEDSQQDTSQSGLININTATVEELTTLPGIGEARAEAIVAYREQHGGVRMVEEITDVTGIGDGILAQVIDKITVGDGEEIGNGENTGGG
jgi:competence protein ComEA